MSYILNALKKAEHDRKREEPEDLDDFVSAGWDPYQEQPKSAVSYKLAIFMNLYIMAFRLGAEPFFFNHSDKKNAKEIYEKLQLEYNKARQQRITMELVEIISGASALD